MASGSGWHRRRQDAAGRRARRRLVLERLCDRWVLASISGAVFDDADLSYRPDHEEAGLQDRLVYLDLNDDQSLGAGEPYRLTDASGNYAFDDLTPGDYVVRLFNGTQSQRQTAPLAPQVDGAIAVAAASQLRFFDGGATLYALRDQAVVHIEPNSGATAELPLPAAAASLHPLPDGRLLVLGSDDPAAAEHAWLVSFAAGSVTAVDLGLQPGETGWASAAIDSTGQGVLIANGAEPTALRQLSLSDGVLTASPTGDFVPPGTTALTSAEATASLIAVPTEAGLTLSLWSNATGTSIVGTSTTIADGATLLDFDDAAGLAVVRSTLGETLVYDVAGGFAMLQRIADLSETVIVDYARDLLLAVDQAGDLVIRDLLVDGVVAQVALAATDAAALALAAGGEAVLVARGSELSRVRLDRPAGHRISLRRGDAAADLMFGLAVQGTNSAPQFRDGLAFEVAEDTPLEISAATMLAGAADADAGDTYVLLPQSTPTLGSASVTPGGSLLYQPRANVFGGDQLSVVLHDGRTASQAASVQVTVTPVDDPLGPVTMDLPAGIPETTPPGTAVGTITVANPDPGEVITLVAEDPRFEIHDNLIFFIGPESLDYESEPDIAFTVLANDAADGAEYPIADVLLHVTDVNEPIVDITPHTATVQENDSGAVISWIEVVDSDYTGEYSVQVDDDRFEVVDNHLQLVAGVALDYEAEPEVVVQLTAVDSSPDGNQLTRALTITVGDVNEMPTSIWFEGDSVLERLAGATIGLLMTDDPDQPSTASFSVDDSRFEFAGPLLKLRDGVWVERAIQEQIELTLTATDSAFTMSIDVVIDVLANDHPYQNPDMDGDVDGDGSVDALDALIIINHINSNGPGPIVNTVNTGGDGFYVDVNGDGMVTPLDALLVINILNQEIRPTSTTATGENEGEGESPAGAPAPQPTSNQFAGDRLATGRQTPITPSAAPSAQRKADGFDAVDRQAADDWMQHYADTRASRQEAADRVDTDWLANRWPSL